MRTRTHRFRRALGIAAALAPLWWSASSAAEMREFTGRVSRVDEQRLVVGNRMGDALSFERSPETEVRGAKRRWDAIDTSDRVTVHWSFSDKPRRARRVVVFPPR